MTAVAMIAARIMSITSTGGAVGQEDRHEAGFRFRRNDELRNAVTLLCGAVLRPCRHMSGGAKSNILHLIRDSHEDSSEVQHC